MLPVRLQVDPQHCRIGVRQYGLGLWLISLTQRGSNDPPIQAVDRDPGSALSRVLMQAAKENVSGLNLNLDWTFPHPQQPGC